MFSTLRNRFGIPGVISVIALVFAMLGGAYAASNSGGGKGATASAVKKVKGPRGPKGATGPAGPAGAQGPAGPAGAKGDTGAAGAAGEKGATGAAGQSVKSVEEPPGGNCAEGGFKLTSASGTQFVCNGAQGAKGDQGEPWVAGQAPSGAILRGTWAIPNATAGEAEERIPVVFSTGVPVGQLEGVDMVPPGGPDPLEFLGFGCTGSTVNPTPPELPGSICAYAQTTTNLQTWDISDLGVSAGSGNTSGGAIALPRAKAAGTVKAFGVWVLKVK